MAYYNQAEAARLMAPVDGLGNALVEAGESVPGYVTWHPRPYPTRFHGGIWTRPVFGVPTVRVPTAVFSPSNLYDDYPGGGPSTPPPCNSCSGVGTSPPDAETSRRVIYTTLAGGLIAAGLVAGLAYFARRFL